MGEILCTPKSSRGKDGKGKKKVVGWEKGEKGEKGVQEGGVVGG